MIFVFFQLHMLVRDAQMLHRHLPSSPVTPTSRYPLSPHSHPPTPNWSALAPPDSPFYTQHFQHFMAGNSVTLSPAPSTDSQAGSPPQSEQVQNGNFSQSGSSSAGSNGAASNQSDSDEDAAHSSPPTSNNKSSSNSSSNHVQTSSSVAAAAAAVSDSRSQQHQHHQQHQPQHTTKHLPPPLVLEPKILNAWSLNDNTSGTATPSPSTPISSNGANNSIKREFFPNPPTPSTPSSFFQVKREFFPDTPEPNTSKSSFKKNELK